MEILRVENLTFRYPGTQEDAVSDVSFTVREGDFIVLCGSSGCGKTTLLKLCKRELSPFGERDGEIYYDGEPISGLNAARCAGEIGYVTQDPDNGIVTDKVWHELAFGLENLGTPPEVIRRRVGEMASCFGIESYFRARTDELSGGQKQTLNLASVMVMQPRLLLLDEPTSQLDPIAASGFIAALSKLNRELGLTIILAEHRLEEVFPVADRVLLMENGRLIAQGTPREVAGAPGIEALSIYGGLPAAVRISRAIGAKGSLPLTVREGRDYLLSHYSAVGSEPEADEPVGKDTAVSLRNIWFRYEKNTPDVLRGLSLNAYKGEFLAILGGNGSGKTTMLDVVSGLSRAYRGDVIINGKQIREYKGGSLYRGCLAFLPQDPSTVFVRDTVIEDLTDVLMLPGIDKAEAAVRAGTVLASLGVEKLSSRHPFDLSGGERQKCALAKLLLSEPRIILLDEPTKGLDAVSKAQLASIIDSLTRDGRTVIAVTHDIEFAAEYADRCALLFDGEIISTDTPRRFFSKNSFYTTAANRMARGLFPNDVTCAGVVESCRRSGGGL